MTGMNTLQMIKSIPKLDEVNFMSGPDNLKMIHYQFLDLSLVRKYLDSNCLSPEAGVEKNGKW